jgi:SAM-dependent methyltransferase
MYKATDGSAYEIFLGRWTQRLAQTLLNVARLPETGPILDAGCGTGSFAIATAKRWPLREIVGTDIAASYIDYARRRREAGNLRFEVADVTQVPYVDRYFDSVVAQLVLNFVPDPLAAVREMIRITKRGGPLIACVWDFRGGLVYQRMFWDTAAVIDEGAAKVRDKLFSNPLALPEGLTDLFRAGGLVDVERASITIRMDFVSFYDYWRPLCGGQGPLGSYVDGLPLTLRSRIEEAVAAAYRSGVPDGPRSLTATAWAVRGVVP